MRNVVKEYRKINFSTIITLSFLVLSSCSVIQKSGKQKLSDGVYFKKAQNEKQKVFANIENDNIQIYPIITRDKKVEIDTLKSIESYAPYLKTKENSDFTLIKGSFDLDLLIIPSKLRFARNNVPPQLNSEFNGVIFLGFRNDIYKLKYQTNPLNISERKILHFGYSIGLINGIGNTFMSPTTTNNTLQQEYDGIVWSKGIAAIIGVNNISVSVAIGFDNLLDQNRTIWIYENKSWVGLGFGLNLN